MNIIKSQKSLIGVIGLSLVILVSSFALAIAQTQTETSTSTTEVVAEPVSEDPATSTPAISTPENTTPVATEIAAETNGEPATAIPTDTIETAITTEETVVPALPKTVSATIVESSPTIQDTGPKVSVDLDCSLSYVGDLYETPSGHLEEGYYPDVVPATTTGKIATKVGIQAWTVCYDESGIPHEFTLTDQEYADLAKPDATMPKKSIMVPIVQ